MKKKELERKIQELVVKVNVMAKREMLLLMYQNYVTKLCLQDTQSMAFYKEGKNRELSDLFFKFHVHAFTAYFTKEFFKDYRPIIREDKEYNDGWNAHVKDVLQEIFDKETEKIEKKYESKKSSDPNYVT